MPFRSPWLAGPVDHHASACPDHWEVIEEATPSIRFGLATSPSRGFLNSTFNETPTSRARARPTVRCSSTQTMPQPRVSAMATR